MSEYTPKGLPVVGLDTFRTIYAEAINDPDSIVNRWKNMETENPHLAGELEQLIKKISQNDVAMGSKFVLLTTLMYAALDAQADIYKLENQMENSEVTPNKPKLGLEQHLLIIGDPSKWELNAFRSTANSMLDPNSVGYSTLPFIIGSARDPKTKEIDPHLVKQEVVGLYLP